jgi:hypothetical protein
MKRFTETDKWSDPWFQNLSHGSKLLFIYLCDKCNNGGFYENNPREACFQLGITEDQHKGALKGLERGIIEADGWIFVKNFLKHQKNLALNQDNPAHKQIIFFINEQLPRFGKNAQFQDFVAPLKGLLRGTGIVKDKVKAKERVPFNLEQAERIYQEYPRKEGRGVAIESISKALKEGANPQELIGKVRQFSECMRGKEMQFIPHPATWFNQKRWLDDPATWAAHSRNGHSQGSAI